MSIDTYAPTLISNIEKLQKCVNSDAYGTTYPKTSLCRLSHESSSRSCDLVESSFDKCGLLVVKPTAAQYLRFDELIETIEDSVGRVQGVCKILVPQDRSVACGVKFATKY